MKSKVIHKLIACILLAGLVFSCGKEEIKKPVKYFVDTFVGKVEVSHDDGKTWSPVEADMILVKNDIIKTGKESYCDIVMPERGLFRVSFNSILLLAQLSEGVEHIKVEKGKINLNVTSKLKKEEVFKVETESSVVLVRGTQFLVEADSEVTKIVVKDGTVAAHENIELTITDQEILNAIQDAITFELQPKDKVIVSKKDAKKLENALNNKLKDVKNKKQAADLAMQLRQEFAPKKTTVSEEELENEFKDITAADKVKKVGKITQNDIQALEELTSEVGMASSGAKTEEQAVEMVMESAKEKSGMGKKGSKIVEEMVNSDNPTTIEEDIAADEPGKLLDRVTGGDKKSHKDKTTKPGGKAGSMLGELGAD